MKIDQETRGFYSPKHMKLKRHKKNTVPATHWAVIQTWIKQVSRWTLVAKLVAGLGCLLCTLCIWVIFTSGQEGYKKFPIPERGA